MEVKVIVRYNPMFGHKIPPSLKDRLSYSIRRRFKFIGFIVCKIESYYKTFTANYTKSGKLKYTGTLTNLNIKEMVGDFSSMTIVVDSEWVSNS